MIDEGISQSCEARDIQWHKKCTTCNSKAIIIINLTIIIIIIKGLIISRTKSYIYILEFDILNKQEKQFSWSSFIILFRSKNRTRK